MGGVGNWARDADGGVAGRATGAGAPSSACRLRQVEKMFPIAFWADICGGLAGGDANSADCRRVSGGCDESHEKADGRSMAAVVERRWRSRGDCAACGPAGVRGLTRPRLARPAGHWRDREGG